MARDKKLNAKYSRDCRKRRKEKGLCIRCGKNKDTTKTKCSLCLVKCRELERLNDLKTKKNVMSHYGNKCNCCGESGLAFLNIDHIDNNGNAQRKFVPSGGRQFYKYIIRNGYPNDLQILCWNCNMGKHLNNGACPHKEK